MNMDIDKPIRVCTRESLEELDSRLHANFQLHINILEEENRDLKIERIRLEVENRRLQALIS